MSDKNEFDEKETPMDKEQDFSTEEGLAAEAWQDDAPPEDGFHDNDMTHEDIVEEEPVDETGYETPASGKDRGKTIFYGALGVAALLVGGMLVMQFVGGNGDKAEPQPYAASTTPPDMPAPSMAAPAQTTGETDMAAIYEAAQKQQPSGGTSAMPDLKTPESAAVTTEIMGLTEVESAVSNTPSVAQVENIPVQPVASVAAAPAPEVAVPPVKPERAAPVVAAEPVHATVSQGADVDARLKDMTDKIKALETALEQSMQKNADLVARLETLSSAAAPSNVEERLVKLEQQKTSPAPKAAKEPAKAKAPVKKTAAAVERESVSGTLKVPEQPDSSAGIVTDLLSDDQVNKHLKEEMGMAEPKKEKAAKPARAKKEPKAKKEAKIAPVKQVKAKSNEGGLTLRAATPDAAWVSGDPQSHELQRVTVGESLPGVGTVKEIRQNGDQWELVGTEGTLR